MKTTRSAAPARITLLAIFLTILTGAEAYPIGISPMIAGNGSNDSVYITIVSVDTTFYPEVADLDSLDILRYTPDATLLDSTSEDASNVLSISKGYYRAAFRASDGFGTKGVYTVVVRGWLAGKERGIAAGAYEVIEIAFEELVSSISSINVRTDSIKDTVDSYLPISGGNADTAAIARSVWDDDVAALALRRVAYADSVGTVLSIPSTGAGAYACSLYYFDTADTSAAQGVAVRAMNSMQTATSAVGISNSNGLAVLSLDAATYMIWSYKAGYSFLELPDSVVVANPSVMDTIWCTHFRPGDPPSPSLCRVYGWVNDISGEGISGATVTANVRRTPLRFGSVIISPYFRSTVTDTAGYWYLDLIPSCDFDPPSTLYVFSIYYQTGAIAVTEAEVPDSLNWELSW